MNGMFKVKKGGISKKHFSFIKKTIDVFLNPNVLCKRSGI